MNTIPERREKIRKWLLEYGKFTVNEREPDEGFHFSFWIWDKEGKRGLIPMVIGQLRQTHQEKDCIAIGWGWNLDVESNLVKDVINDPEKTTKFVESLKKVIDPKKYILKFLPNEKSIDSIKVTFVYPIDWMDKESLFNEIMNTWLQYGNMILHMELKSGRPTSIDLNRFRKSG